MAKPFHASFGRNCVGSTLLPLTVREKWRCGVSLVSPRAVLPTEPMTVAMVTVSPSFTAGTLARFEQVLTTPAPWSMTTVVPMRSSV